MKKNFILGFISGGIICAAVTGFAVEYAVTPNPYPVKVNGTETTIEGYNINDSTYFKLRDIADTVGDFRVDFVNNEIALTKVNPAPAPAPTLSPTPTPVKAINEIADGEAVDGINTKLIDDKWSVDINDIESKYSGKYDFLWEKDGIYSVGRIEDGKYVQVFQNCPQGGKKFTVELTWYNTVLQPWLASEGWRQ